MDTGFPAIIEEEQEQTPFRKRDKVQHSEKNGESARNTEEQNHPCSADPGKEES